MHHRLLHFKPWYGFECLDWWIGKVQVFDGCILICHVDIIVIVATVDDWWPSVNYRDNNRDHCLANNRLLDYAKKDTDVVDGRGLCSDLCLDFLD